ncbi:MAG: helix-turn-helix domain-containing protein [Bradyrhizobiaceae bacterium]|nr:helix-turn-helix domain-containing protein [Bradyrhizobiaceae bacterium]
MQNEQEQIFIQMTKDQLVELIRRVSAEDRKALIHDLEIRLRPDPQKPKEESSYLTVRELQQELGFSEPIILKLCKNDSSFPAVKVGSEWRVRRVDLNEWWESKKGKKKAGAESPSDESVEVGSGSQQ